MVLKFDNVELNDGSTYRVTDLKHESTPEIDTFSYGLARQRGSVYVTSEYKSKEISVSGIIKGVTRAQLEQNIDTFKEVLSRKNKSLDIEYAGGTRRYANASVVADKIVRKSSDITIAWWELTFMVPEGVGVAISSVTDVLATNYASEVNTVSVDIAGNTYPNPIITLNIDAASGITSTYIKANGDKIQTAESITASDVIVFDTDSKKVTQNGTRIDYTGIFPRIYPGINSIEIGVVGTSRQYDASMTYYAKYL